MPYSAVYAEILGFHLVCYNKFNVSLHCLIRQQNKCIRKFVSVLKSPAMKWFSKIWIALSDAFLLCAPVGTIWTYIT